MLPPRLDGLLDPAAYEPRPELVELRETHISWVLLAGGTAFKVKKPLTLPFLDYGSLGRRRMLCHEEVALNARLAPEIYHGVRAVVPADGGLRIAEESHPGAIEYAVEMRRYDERNTLARRLADGSADAGELRAVGRRIAEFHAEAPTPGEPERTVRALDSTLRENLATLREQGVELDDAAELADAVLVGRREDLVGRARRGLVRDGHGDLRAEHIVLERGIEIVDCVEFDPTLRRIDTGLDLAFLVMDVMRVDGSLATALVEGYRGAGGDPGDDALLQFFAAQRALIRAKVSLIRAGQVSGSDADRRRADAAALIALAGRLGWQLRLGRIAVVCGPAASGKTTLAAALAARSGARVVSSDVVRKQLLGLEPTERAPLTAYDRRTNLRTYAALGREAARAGDSVLVDATFRFAEDRATFINALGGDDVLWIECRASPSVVARRAAARGRRPSRISDADPGVAVRSVAEFEPLTEARHVAVATAEDVTATLVVLRRALDDRLRGSGRRVDEVVLERVPDELGT